MTTSLPHDETSQPPPLAEVPRLAVKHILLWMTFIAAIIAFYNRTRMPDGTPQSWLFRASVIESTFRSSLCYTGMTVLLVSWFRGRRPLFAQPGHWFLASSMGRALELVVSYLARAFPAWSEGLPALPIVLIIVYTCIYPAIMCWAAYCEREPRWRSVFILHAIAALSAIVASNFAFMAGLHALGAIGMVMVPASYLWLLFNAIRDVIGATRRDWLHWCGILTMVETIIMFLVSIVAFSFG